MIGVSPLPTVIGLATVTGDQGPAGPRQIYFGCASSTFTTTPAYYYPNSTIFTITTLPVPVEVNVAGYLRNLFVRTTTNACDTDTTFVVYLNGSATALSVVLTAGSVAMVFDTTNQITVAAGDKITFRSTRPAGTFGIGLGTTYAMFEAVPT
ncbi:MAG: hypothetical protein H0U64_06825 [Gemmatimonadaceae bacterium]|nr:hypothetical protein [Gemmatimonadaceae bacterium]